MIPIGTNVRVGQDIAFPRQSVFPTDTSYSAGKRGPTLPRRTARPFGVPGATVTEPGLGDVADTIGGGTEALGPGQTPGFPGGATFTPPPPFPEAAPTAAPSGLDRALRIGGLAIGGGKQVASLIRAAQPKEAGLGNVNDVVGGATQVPGAAPPQFDLAGDLEASFTPPPGGGTQVPEFGLGDLGDLEGEPSVTPPNFDIAADLESSLNPPSTSGETGGEFGLGDVAGGIGAAAGIASTAMSNRPDWQKALISSGQAGSFAAPVIAAQVGGQAAGGVAGTVAGGVGLAISLAMLGETLSKSNDANATEAQRIAADREKTKAVMSAGASLATLGGSLLLGPEGGAIGGVISLGIAIDSLARMLDKSNQGPPLGQNWTDYKSMMTAKYLGDQLPDTFTKATSPLQLLGVALSGPSLSPHGEVQIMHGTWGSGGDYNTPTSPMMTENLSKIAATGDPDLLREFIKGVTVKVGATGSGQDDWLATDTYRRQLVSLLPPNHPVRQEAESGTSNLFQPPSADYTQAGQIEQILNAGYNTPVQGQAPQIAQIIKNIQAGEPPRYGMPVNTPTPSPLFRQPGEFELTPEQRTDYINRLMQMLPEPSSSAMTQNADTGEWMPVGHFDEQGQWVYSVPPPDKLSYWLSQAPYMDQQYSPSGGSGGGAVSDGGAP